MVRIRAAVKRLRSLAPEEREKYYAVFAGELYRCISFVRRHMQLVKLPTVVESAWTALLGAVDRFDQGGWAFRVFPFDIGSDLDIAYDGSLEPDVWWAEDFDALDDFISVYITVDEISAPLSQSISPPDPRPESSSSRSKSLPVIVLSTPTASRHPADDLEPLSLLEVKIRPEQLLRTPPSDEDEQGCPRLLDPSYSFELLPPDSIVIGVPKFRHRDRQDTVEEDNYFVGTKASPAHKVRRASLAES
ncbi:hypothetical protein FA95DRAFT_116470 [Auriscalpium vulgare]|uniref:Uncharacterized protein n=1 Tax=Auriscalpium vulgare TaxID=40419 RepID=A0ACB8RMZ2_9AGAM|nr:hypothetical protein FA95DRAFT_116470 [Auriscalpium vulgare]